MSFGYVISKTKVSRLKGVHFFEVRALIDEGAYSIIFSFNMSKVNSYSIGLLIRGGAA